MNGILDRPALDPCLDAARLHARPAGELWRMWRQVGAALAARGGRAVAGTLREWRNRSLRRANDALLLRRLTEHELRDMGVTRQQALFEVNKPFWRK